MSETTVAVFRFFRVGFHPQTASPMVRKGSAGRACETASRRAPSPGGRGYARAQPRAQFFLAWVDWAARTVRCHPPRKRGTQWAGAHPLLPGPDGRRLSFFCGVHVALEVSAGEPLGQCHTLCPPPNVRCGASRRAPRPRGTRPRVVSPPRVLRRQAVRTRTP